MTRTIIAYHQHNCRLTELRAAETSIGWTWKLNVQKLAFSYQNYAHVACGYPFFFNFAIAFRQNRKWAARTRFEHFKCFVEFKNAKSIQPFRMTTPRFGPFDLCKTGIEIDSFIDDTNWTKARVQLKPSINVWTPSLICASNDSYEVRGIRDLPFRTPSCQASLNAYPKWNKINRSNWVKKCTTASLPSPSRIIQSWQKNDMKQWHVVTMTIER